MDKVLGELTKLKDKPDDDDKSETCKELIGRASKLIDMGRKITGRRPSEVEEIEKGRKQLVERGAAGGGDRTQKRIRDELNYLIDHYNSTNDMKIETLIDKWRRSGDPSYDPAIRLRFRNARRKKDSGNHAL